MFRGLRSRITERLRRDFVAGLLVIVPVGFTVLGIAWSIRQLDNLVLPKLFALIGLAAEHQPPFVGAVFTLLLILVAGALTRSFIGRGALRYWEHAVDRIPVARSLYTVLKQFMQAIFGSGGPQQQFTSVVLIEYPRKGVWSYAFMTGRLISDQLPGLKQNDLPERLVKVFIPSTPNPTTGYFLMLPEPDVQQTDLSVEDAFKIIISAGIAEIDEVNKPESPPV